KGRTPSPDILCNQYIKFGTFLEETAGRVDKVASGHYARIEKRDGIYYLRQAPDPVKDQTYFLASLSQEQLEKIIFPIGHLRKEEVRELALKCKLPSCFRKDSQGICFLGKIRYNDFVKFHLGEKPGAVIEKETGDVKGRHKGVWFYTIGQRQGLGLSGGPWYVVDKDIKENTVFISHNNYMAGRKRCAFNISDIHWISGKPPAVNDFYFKLRHGPHRSRGKLANMHAVSSRVILEQGDQGIAPGQSCIFYQGDYCLGRGIISS
ncbi:MAG TPA: tRNA 2-thiouridine(34) synthase MnmA, partial [Spirochaetota bacterium]|nr:tRNA 2-thiouridine(34) synthase MnmA [Spirochaetota bacterium]